jgi:hypothetical protein
MNIKEIKDMAEDLAIHKAQQTMWDNWDEEQRSVTKEVQIEFEHDGLDFMADATVNFFDIYSEGEYAGVHYYDYKTEIEKIEVWVIEKKII